jgi:hypothetical protein
MVDLVGEFVRAAAAKPLARLAPLVKEIMKEYVRAPSFLSDCYGAVCLGCTLAQLA